MRNQDRDALDRLIAEQAAKDAEREAKRKRRQEHQEWQRTPMCSWTTYFIILAVLSPIVLIAVSYTEAYSKHGFDASVLILGLLVILMTSVQIKTQW